MRKPSVISLVVAAVIVSFTVAVVGQEVAADKSLQYRVQVKNGHSVDFEAAMRDHTAWRKANGETWPWGVWQMAVGPDMGAFVIFSGWHTWQDFDAYMGSKFDSQARGHWLRVVGPHVESISSVVSKVEVIRWPEGMENPPLVLAENLLVQSGKYEALIAAVRKVDQAIKEADAPFYYMVTRALIGAEGVTLSIYTPVKDWTELEEKPGVMKRVLTEAYGEEETAKIWADFYAGVKGSDTSTWAFRPDLSLLLP